MSVGTAGTAETIVLRASGTLAVPVAVWAVGGLAIADAVVEGTVVYALRVAVLVAAIAFAAWLVLASPRLEVEREGLRIVNPLRVHWIPFAALDDVRVRGLTTITARDVSGRLRDITSWNAPGVPRRHTKVVAPVAEIIERFRAAWEQSAAGDIEAVLTTSWRWRPGLGLLTLAAASIAIWFR